MERYWVANGILVPNECGGLVKYDDAQATVEALQAQLESANTLLHKKNCAIGKAEMAIEALQRERDAAIQAALKEGIRSGHMQAALDAEREKVENLEHKIQSRGGLALIDDARAKAGLYDQLETKLEQLQALVRALPVPEEGGFPIVEVDGDYYVNHTARFSTKAEADAYTGLLIYRATLDATTPAGGQG